MMNDVRLLLSDIYACIYSIHIQFIKKIILTENSTARACLQYANCRVIGLRSSQMKVSSPRKWISGSKVQPVLVGIVILVGQNI